MLQTMFLQPIRTIISLLLMVFGFYYLTKMGVPPLLAAIGVLLASGIFRFAVRFLLMIVFVVMVLAMVILFFAWL